MGVQTYLPTEILDYVETHSGSEEVVFGISQRELAKALGYHPCSMSRPLADLVEGGLLISRRGLVRGGLRRQLTYRLTEAGRTRLHRETREVPLLAGAIPPPPHPFLGRREELAQLTDFSQEGGSITFVDGPPGMGKTALVSRHLRRVKQGRVPFWFTVRPASSPRQFVTSLAHALAPLGASQLAYYTQIPRPPVTREVVDLTKRALGNREMVAVIDDVQVAGPDVRRFLEEFATALSLNASHQFLFVSQEPPIFETPRVRVHRLTIGGLDRAAAHELTDRQGGLGERFEAMYKTSLGSPLLLQLAISNPELEANAALLPIRVIERLPLEEARALLPIALSNEPMPATFVTEPGQVSAARLAELIKMGLLQRALQGRIEVLQVVRTALTSRLGPSEERVAHLSLAAFYARSRRPEAIRERFLHLVQGESWKGASQLLARQQRILLGLGYSELLRNSLRRLSSALPRSPAKVRTLEAEATLLRHHSEYSEAVTVLRKAIAESNGEPRTVAESTMRIVELYLRMGDIGSAKNEFQGVQKPETSSRRLQVFRSLTEARLLEGEGNSQDARGRFQRAFDQARRYHVTDLGLEAIAAWSRLEELQSGPETVLETIASAIPAAREAGRPDIVFNLRLLRARAYLRLENGPLAEEEMRLVRSEAESLGFLNQLAYTLDGMAAAAGQAGRWSEAIEHSRHAMALAERLGNDTILGHSLALLSAAEFRQVYQGRAEARLIDDAIANGERSVEVLSRLPPSDLLILAHGYLAEIYAYSKDTSKAVGHYDQAIAMSDQLGLPWLKESLAKEVAPRIDRR